jgi:hypothetical protein
MSDPERPREPSREKASDESLTKTDHDRLREHFERISFDREPTDEEREQAARESADDDEF